MVPGLLNIKDNLMPKARSYCVAVLLGSSLLLGVHSLAFGGGKATSLHVVPVPGSTAMS